MTVPDTVASPPLLGASRDHRPLEVAAVPVPCLPREWEDR